MTNFGAEPEPKPAHRSFRLTRPSAQAVASQLRPAIVLPDRDARALLAAAEGADVSRGGCFCAGPAGVQLWSGPWDGPVGSQGGAQHVGSVDWSYDTPNRHYITVYRVLVTREGVAGGYTASDVLQRVLDLAGIVPASDRLSLTPPPRRDPFRAVSRQGLTGATQSLG